VVCARVVTTVEAHESVIGVGAKKANLELCPRLLFGLGLGLLGLLLGICLGLGLLLGLCLGPGLGPGRLDRRSGFGLGLRGGKLWLREKDGTSHTQLNCTMHTIDACSSERASGLLGKEARTRMESAC
jgi:hypothetical protein